MIHIISTTSIRPERLGGDNEDQFSGSKIDLGPSDLRLLLVDYIQKGLLFHKPPGTTTFCLLNNLKAAFGQTINIFYPLAGRLISIYNNDDDDTKSFFIDCNAAGAEFVHATADGKISAADILEPDIIPDELVYSFFTMNRVLNYEAAVASLPLLSVQVTELSDAVFVSISLNHCAGDRTFFWRLFATWSEIARGSSVKPLIHRRVFGREFLHGIIANLPIRIPKRCLAEALDSSSRPDLGVLNQRMFRFSKAQIAELKSRANAEASDSGTEISSFQALLTHLWIAVTRSRGLDSRETVRYRMAVGVRKRLGLEKDLPEEYMGNAVNMTGAVSTSGEVVRARGLGAVAMLINRAVASQTVSEVRSQLKAWAERPAMKQIGFIPLNTLLTGSSPRFDVYGCDFGWGAPVAVRSGPGNKFDGKLTVFPGSELGSVDFEVCFSAKTLCALASDPEFTHTLS